MVESGDVGDPGNAGEIERGETAGDQRLTQHQRSQTGPSGYGTRHAADRVAGSRSIDYRHQNRNHEKQNQDHDDRDALEPSTQVACWTAGGGSSSL
jgi:hypothetical protein